MNETTSPPMKPLNELLILEALFLYCVSNVGGFTVDKTTKTITLDQPYTFDTSAFTYWENSLNNAKEQYINELEPNQEMSANDQQLFLDIENWIQIGKQLFEIT
tara:strand:+ start:1473 stop:1784 length:312 start_codon:yes stop_codon:yes gene_type:complete